MKSFTLAAILAATTALVSAAPAAPTAENPCDIIKCASGTICQPSPDGKQGSCVPESEQRCGDEVICGHGSRCCNPVMGICVTPPDMFCIMGGANSDSDSDSDSTSDNSSAAQSLNEAAGPCDDIVCTGDQICQPSPDASTAECVPFEEQRCGDDVICPHGQRCCNPFLGICITPPDMACPRSGGDGDNNNAATDATTPPPPPPAAMLETSQQDGRNGTFCGPGFCTDGDECCNPSCGICTAPGGACTLQFCSPGAGPQCGTKGDVCPFGWECCNASCGTCVPPGGVCTQEICSD